VTADSTKMVRPYVHAVKARREPGSWIVDVPQLDVTTQARRLAEIAPYARKAIGVWPDVEPDDVNVAVTVEAPEDVRLLIDAKNAAVAAQERAAEQLAATVTKR
jgi:hypothetical protein